MGSSVLIQLSVLPLEMFCTVILVLKIPDKLLRAFADSQDHRQFSSQKDVKIQNSSQLKVSLKILFLFFGSKVCH